MNQVPGPWQRTRPSPIAAVFVLRRETCKIVRVSSDGAPGERLSRRGNRLAGGLSVRFDAGPEVRMIPVGIIAAPRRVHMGTGSLAQLSEREIMLRDASLGNFGAVL
ncbi:hypothetical protein CORC01_02907 [Colletotrichum orchidophilum]|uniref:Uncharacterized protein n=1 Tax=Colletotrichum orchidophilum TaxID=1209926 RepID=A0A1G4BK77_9PEZI|nr:uncharacterized protein CORC01_02907 [Colletotrichum orchidophilum]OHF01716.1 hypothetical protein CORC01_02907 [Colletotrichum orchidophilum]